MNDPTMPEVPPVEVLWAICNCTLPEDFRCKRCTSACGNDLTAKYAYDALRAELVRQQEKNRE